MKLLGFAPSAGLAAAMAASLASPTMAQDADAGSDEDDASIICVSIAYGWVGSREDLLRIRENPVPISFRRNYEGGGCGRFQLIESSLLSWHLAFGDEASATGAIEYLEGASLPNPLSAHTLPAQMSQRFEEAWPSLVQGNALWEAREHDAYRRFRYSNPDPDLQRLYELTNAVYQHRFLADSWLRASRFHSSAAMLERARPHMEVVIAYDAFLKTIEERQAQIPSMRLKPFDDYETEFSVLERRYLVQRALLLGELDGLPPDRPNARNEEPETRLQEVFETGIDFQEINELNEDFQVLEDRLDEDDGDEWARNVVLTSREEVLANFARDMHATDPDFESHRTCDSGRLYEAQQGLETMDRYGHSYAELRGYSSSNFGGAWRDDRLMLLLAQTQCHRVIADKALEAENPEAMFSQLQKAIYALTQARQLVQPDESPGRFRQVAQNYLEIRDHCRTMFDEHQGRFGSCYDYNPRLAAYFETSLQALDYIAYGAEGVEEDNE